MEFFGLVKKRHSVRNFSSRPVESQKIEKILSVARTAPSAGNLKAYKIIVVDRVPLESELAQISSGMQFLTLPGPVVLVFCALPEVSAAEYEARGKNLYAVQDATIACAYAQLAAAELGLGACWVGAFDEQAVKSLLDLEQKIVPVALLPVGYEG